jgi:hypothetical protein
MNRDRDPLLRALVIDQRTRSDQAALDALSKLGYTAENGLLAGRQLDPQHGHFLRVKWGQKSLSVLN